MEVLPFIIPMFLLPMIQELIHSLIIVGIRVSVFKYDFNDVISLDLPSALDETITSFLQYASTLMCFLLLSTAALVDEGFAVCAVRG